MAFFEIEPDAGNHSSQYKLSYSLRRTKMEQETTENGSNDTEENIVVSAETEESPGTQAKPDEVDGPNKENEENLTTIDKMEVPDGDAADTHDQGTSPLPAETGEIVVGEAGEGGEKQHEEDGLGESILCFSGALSPYMGLITNRIDILINYYDAQKFFLCGCRLHFLANRHF